jgi:hypothetical protein
LPLVKSFNTLSDGKDEFFLKAVQTDMQTIGIFSRLIYLFPFSRGTHGLNAIYLKFWQWFDERVLGRQQLAFSFFLLFFFSWSYQLWTMKIFDESAMDVTIE